MFHTSGQDSEFLRPEAYIVKLLIKKKKHRQIYPFTKLSKRASQLAQWVKNRPAMQEIKDTGVQSLGREEPLEEEIASHSSMLAWGITWTEEPGGLQARES